MAHVSVTSAGAPAAAASDWAPATTATEASIKRMVDVIVPLWLVAILANIAAHDPGVAPLALAGALLAVAFAYLLFLLSGIPAAPTILIAVLTATTMAIAVLGPPIGSLAFFPLVIPWLNMATTVAGALLPGTRGISGVVGISALGGAAVAAGGGVDPLVLSGIIAQGLVGGMCMWGGVSTLREAAAARDAAAAELLAARTRAAAQQAQLAEHRRVARTLHDTAINTLGAIRALPVRDTAALRRRCAADLAELDRAWGGPRTLAELSRGLQVHAGNLGVDLTVEMGGDAAADLPGDVAEAIDGALREALVNVAKHAGTGAARLVLHGDGVSGRAEVSDNGPGFAGSAFSRGSAQSIAARAAEAGVAVRAYDRDGAVIELTWVDRGQRSQRAVTELPPQRPAAVLGLAAARVGLAMTAFGAYSTAVTPAGSGRVGSAVATVLVGLVGVGWGAGVHRGRLPERLPLVCYPLAVLAATLLPGIGMAGCARIGWYWWGPLAGLVVLVAVVLIDGRAMAVVLAVAGYATAFAMVFTMTSGIDATCSAETVSILVLDLGIVAAIAALRRALIRQSRAAEQLWITASQAELAMVDSRTRFQVRGRELQRVAGIARPLLAGIAAGQLDPADPQTREAAGRAETALRAVNSVPPELGVIGAGIADAVVAAAARGATVSVLVTATSPPDDQTSAERAATHVLAWGARLPAGQAAQVTVLDLGDRALMLLSGPAVATLPAPAGWTCEDDGGLTLQEFSWPVGPMRSGSPMSPSRTASR